MTVREIKTTEMHQQLPFEEKKSCLRAVGIIIHIFTSTEKIPKTPKIPQAKDEDVKIRSGDLILAKSYFASHHST